MTWLVFTWLGVRYAALWGVAAGVLNCIPYFGPTIIMVASSAAALMQFRSLSMVAMVALTSVAITALEGFLLAPIALGRAASVNSVAIFVAVMFWGWMWGPIGLILARAGADDRQDRGRSRRVAVEYQRTARRSNNR